MWSENKETNQIHKIFKHIHDQYFLKLVLNTNAEALLILNENC